MSLFQTMLQLALACVLATAALAKLSDGSAFRHAVLGFGLPLRVAIFAGILVPPVELALAAGIVFAPMAGLAAASIVLLLLVFTAGAVLTLATGRRPSCGCFGRSRPVGPYTFGRNTTLIGAALLLAGRGTPLRLGIGMAVAAAIVIGVPALATYRYLVRRGDELLQRDRLEDAVAEAATVPPSRLSGGSLALAGALAATVPAAARPADDLTAVKLLLEEGFRPLEMSGERAAARMKTAAARPNARTRRAARHALETHRTQILALRTRALALTLVDAQAENARRLAAESLALFASSIASAEASMSASSKVAKRKLTTSRKLLGEAVLRGSRASLLLGP